MALFRKYNTSIHLNGSLHDCKSIHALNTAGLEEWEIKILNFLNEWISDESFIRVRTSGSTGAPKIIQLSKDSMVQSALFTANYLNLKQGDRALLNLPLDYIGGKMMIVRAFVLGLRLSTIKPTSVLRIRNEYDFGAMTPLQLKASLNKYPDSLGHFSKLILGGSAPDAELLKKISADSALCFSTYGMTETSSHIALKSLNGPNKSDRYELVDPSITIKTDVDSCLEIHAPYLGNQGIKTRDMVAIIDEKHFVWKGRIDNVINSGAYKIHPELLEQKLDQHLSQRFFIFGTEHKFYGQRPAILMESDQTSLAPDLIPTLQKVLNKIEIPDQLFILKPFIETDNGKINRKACIALGKKLFDINEDHGSK